MYQMSIMCAINDRLYQISGCDNQIKEKRNWNNKYVIGIFL